jgi:hypothetical protein
MAGFDRVAGVGRLRGCLGEEITGAHCQETRGGWGYDRRAREEGEGKIGGGEEGFSALMTGFGEGGREEEVGSERTMRNQIGALRVSRKNFEFRLRMLLRRETTYTTFKTERALWR